LATFWNNLGDLQSEVGNLDAALISARKGLEIRRKLVDENPTVPEYQAWLAED